MALPVIDNLTARRLFLHRHALVESPAGPSAGPALAALVDRIGFVQVDSINTVERAHHMILWSRRATYRPESLKPLLERDRCLWEHWTHDASVLPVGVYGHWKHRFARDRQRLVDRWTGWQREGFHHKFDEVLKRVSDGGPVSSSEVGEGEARGSGGWWDWHPSKAALEYLWRVGDLAVCRRDGFRKVYDLTERVIPEAARRAAFPEEQSLDWACASALDRLGFATSGELAAYWALFPPEAAKGWVRAALADGRLQEAEVEGWAGARRRVVLRPDTLAMTPPAPPRRLRILSPFDPALRDRTRAEHLFGFSYRIEVFVPEARRRYGYYVFPVLEGDRLIGRLDARAQRDGKVLELRAWWPEPGIRLGTERLFRLERELHRLARFARCDRVGFLPGWQRQTL